MVESAVRVTTIHCSGSPFEIGLAHGRQTSDLISVALDSWRAAIAIRQPNVERYLHDLVHRTGFLPVIERFAPDLLDELRGIAHGADQPVDLMLAYNLLDEEWSYRTGALVGMAPGCTAVSLKGAAIGQTMDIPSVHDGSQVVLNIHPENSPDKLVFTAAGMLGLNGANRSGVGVVVNNLAQLPSSASGLPVIFVLRRILDHESASVAADWVQSVPHAVGQHYLIADPTETFSLEGAGNGVYRVSMPDRYVHTNHPLANPASSADAAKIEEGSNTHARFNRADHLARSARDQSDIESILADREAPISCARRAGFMTFGGTSIGLTDPPVVHIAPGPPHETNWSHVNWDESA